MMNKINKKYFYLVTGLTLGIIIGFLFSDLSITKNAVASDRDANFRLLWEEINPDDSGENVSDIYRTKVPGGWLVCFWGGEGGLTFYPDPQYTWK